MLCRDCGESRAGMGMRVLVMWLVPCFLVVALVACSGPQAEATAAATQAPVTATVASTKTPTTMPEASATQKAATATVRATKTARATATSGPTATATDVPPTATATRTAPTAVPTNVPTATPLPAPSGTPASGVTIVTFEASATEVEPGQSVTLSWETSGASKVTLYHMMPTGQYGTFWDVATTGSFVYDIPTNEYNWVNFVLTASDAAENYVQDSLSITLPCLDEWFFDGAPDICPTAAPLVSAAAEQYFEHGVMIWVAQEGRIYVLYDEGIYGWDVFLDTWAPGDPESDPTLQPPPGLYQPVRGFGRVWREERDVRDRLGWALAPESGFTTTVQRTSYAKYNETYLRARDGQIWKLEPERSGWEKFTEGTPQGPG